MKINEVLKETSVKSPQWQEGNDAFWAGQKPDHCPYEGEEKAQWLAGWKEASLSSD